ncbi:hypothetical protein ABH926_000819 [Catenulispora sp. GP43]|uniref:hypothetical protein n=1 Tax=Catenulispora sp. GP43 TaxID=3156263 RepID=UPI0035150A00
MSTHIIRYETKPDQAEENQRLTEAVFEQLNAEKPEGLHYATFRMEDGVSFVHIVSYDDDDADPLRPLTAFKAFQQDAAERMVAPPQRGSATVVGSYRFFGE